MTFARQIKGDFQKKIKVLYFLLAAKNQISRLAHLVHTFSTEMFSQKKAKELQVADPWAGCSRVGALGNYYKAFFKQKNFLYACSSKIRWSLWQFKFGFRKRCASYNLRREILWLWIVNFSLKKLTLPHFFHVLQALTC